MSKIILEKEKCINCGSCVGVCPKHFESGEDGKAHLKNSTPENKNEVLEVDSVDCIEDAVDVCPVQCIQLK